MKSDPLRIAWGPFAASEAPAGYGVISNWLGKTLQKAGAHMLGPAEFNWDVAAIIGLPHAWCFSYGMDREDVAWHTMFEMDHLPDGWADVLNKCALAWAPSQDSANLFRAAGVRRPIGVSGYGVNTEFFHAKQRPQHDKMRFLAWGPAFYGRKNLLMAAQAFYRAGLPEDDVELIIKVNEGCDNPVFRDEGGQVIPNIHVVAASWQASQVAEWLRSGDVFIYLSGGEGFGLQPLEAMACGVTCICADNTGMQEYLSPDVALPVECPERVKSINYSSVFGGEPFYQWQPSLDQTIAHIRWCYDHETAVQHIGQRAAAYVAREWTWEQAGVKALALLQEYFG